MGLKRPYRDRHKNSPERKAQVLENMRRYHLREKYGEAAAPKILRITKIKNPTTIEKNHTVFHDADGIPRIMGKSYAELSGKKIKTDFDI
jgi:hypothetical protein